MQDQALPNQQSVPAASQAALVAEACNPAEAASRVRQRSDCHAVPVVAVQVVAGTDKFERPAVASAAAEPARGGRSAGTAAEQQADGRRPAAADRSAVLPETEALPEQAVEVGSNVAATGTAALSTEWPADSGSHTELAAGGTAEPAVPTAVVDRVRTASESAEPKSCQSSMMNNRRSAGTG